MNYHSMYFSGMAYYVLAMDEYKTASDKAQGMGKVVTLFKITTAMFDKAKQVVTTIPANY